jgi:hypothetical protein
VPALVLLVVRYFLGSLALVSGLIFVPLPLPFGIPLILVAITLFAGSTRPIRRLLVRLRRRLVGRRTRRRPRAPQPVAIEARLHEPAAKP